MKNIDAIFFDLDGTLVDSREDIVTAVNYTLKEAGVPEKSYEEIISYVGTGVKDLIIKSLGSEYGMLVDRCVEIFTEYFGEHYADKSKLYPNVKEVLEFYKKKKMIVVTNRRTEMTEGTLKKFGIEQYFKKIIGGDDDNCLKPSSCPIEKALSDVANSDEEYLMVGDMDLDVKAGKEAGIYTCAVTYGIGDKADLEKADPDYLIDDMIKLKDLIK
jgi:HAD superfamily hydrolase (TIGR01549 family)